MNHSSILSRWLPNSKRDSLKLDELEAVLDLIPQAVLFVDLTAFRIILANAHATELTAYMRSELVGMELDTILSCQDPDTSIREALKFSSTYSPADCFLLLTRSGVQLSVFAISTAFQSSNWMLVKLEAEKDRSRKLFEEQKFTQLWHILGKIAHTIQTNNLLEALETVLSLAIHVTEADTAAIYQADGENIELVRIVSVGDRTFFPPKTSPQDLIHVPENPIWLRRNHPATSLQSLARRSGFAYLACAVIGQPYASVGMVALAGRTPPPAILSTALQSIASLATTVLDTITRITNLMDSIRNQNIEVALANKLKDLIQDNLILLTSNLLVFEINQSAERTLGYSTREAQNQAIERILISSEPLDPLFEQALEGKQASVLEDIKLFRRNGDAFSAHIRIVPCEVAGVGQGVAILFQDLSEKEKFRRENEILEQRAVLGEVTASFAHEVRNPINNISTGLQLLEMNLPKDDPNQENIQRLQQDCNRLTALIKSGLSFIRPMEYKMGVVHAKEMLENLVMSWKHRLDRANIQYQLQIETKLPQVEGDLRALEQVFTNLINNAFEALNSTTGDHPKVLTIKARRLPSANSVGHIQVSITDTGSGIPDEIRERIFEPFFTTKGTGTGIGLAIVKRIVTAHKGSISVESIPGGSVFQVQLPIYREKTQPIMENAE
jgi:two-component system, NtrC family, sensor histidine kinase AtoS